MRGQPGRHPPPPYTHTHTHGASSGTHFAHLRHTKKHLGGERSENSGDARGSRLVPVCQCVYLIARVHAMEALHGAAQVYVIVQQCARVVEGVSVGECVS